MQRFRRREENSSSHPILKFKAVSKLLKDRWLDSKTRDRLFKVGLFFIIKWSKMGDILREYKRIRQSKDQNVVPKYVDAVRKNESEWAFGWLCGLPVLGGLFLFIIGFVNYGLYCGNSYAWQEHNHDVGEKALIKLGLGILAIIIGPINDMLLKALKRIVDNPLGKTNKL